MYVTIGIMRTNLHYLTHVPLLASLEKGLLDQLADRCTRKSIEKNEILFFENEKADCMYIILGGRIRIERLTSLGESHTLAVRRTGEIIGEMALINDQTRSAQATAEATCKLLVLHRQNFAEIMLRNPSACLVIMQTLAQRLRELSDVLIDRRSKDVAQRLLDYLQSNSDQEGYVRLNTNQTQLAEVIGCTRESINRALTDLELRGAISRNRRVIQLLS